MIKTTRNNKYGLICVEPTYEQRFDLNRIDKDIFKLCDEKCNIFIWSNDKNLTHIEEDMKKQGYSLHARIVVNKLTGIMLESGIKCTHQYMLWFYKKGHMLMPCKESRGRFKDVINVQSDDYKEYAYYMLDEMFPFAKKIKLHIGASKCNIVEVKQNVLYS